VHYLTLDESDLIEIHKNVIEPNEIQGLAMNKSLSAVLARLQNRLDFGLITDVFHYAACMGIFIAKARCFNDANKRTAAAALHLILIAHECKPKIENTDLGDWIVKSVVNELSEEDLAGLLRTVCES
jgi:death-on-curing protein